MASKLDEIAKENRWKIDYSKKGNALYSKPDKGQIEISKSSVQGKHTWRVSMFNLDRIADDTFELSSKDAIEIAKHFLEKQ